MARAKKRTLLEPARRRSSARAIAGGLQGIGLAVLRDAPRALRTEKGIEPMTKITGWKQVAAAVVALVLAGVVAAQSPTAGPRGGLSLPVDPQFLNDLPEVKGVVSWKLLGQVKSAQVGTKIVPDFASEIRLLDQQEVRLQGYMMPIVAGETHSHFLLTMRPPHCPFCLSIGPEYIVEVKSEGANQAHL
jgi:hypothetical protein